MQKYSLSLSRPHHKFCEILILSSLSKSCCFKMDSVTRPKGEYPPVKLPYPFLTTYRVQRVSEKSPRLFLTLQDQPAKGRALPQPLHSDKLSWVDLTLPSESERPPISDNSPWARARRSPSTNFQWEGEAPPSLAQVWNVVHAIYLCHPANEYFRVTLAGEGADTVRDELLATGLGVHHPKSRQPRDDAAAKQGDGELLILRSSFWQGAASPTGPRPIWVVGENTDKSLRTPLAQYPVMPENYQITNRFPDEPVYTRHPVRRPKPYPGSIAYSRYIVECDMHFSLEVIDWQNDEHLRLFNTWQNDPRVAKGWNETGTLDQHREYLRKLHFDPHVLCLFGRFDETRFAYYELYWAKVSTATHNLPLFHDISDMPPLGGPLRRPLRRRPLRPRPALPGRRRLVPRRGARQRVVLELHPLLLPGRPAHRKRRGRAKGQRAHDPVV